MRMVITTTLEKGQAQFNSPYVTFGVRIGHTYSEPVPSAISTVNLCADYGDTHALCDVSIELPEASSLAIIGPNGSGKSTLLGVLAGTIDAVSGTAAVSGRPPALVLQSTDVDRSLPITVRDTVSLARYPSLGLLGRFRAEDKAAVDTALERLDVADLADRQLHELSGGQRQRVLVAQGVAQETGVLLLDEPITGLDMTSRSIILDLIDEETANGRTVVMTTHNLEEARRCGYVLILNSSAIAFGTPDEAMTADNLRRAFGGKFIQVGDEFILDDPHHHHH